MNMNKIIDKIKTDELINIIKNHNTEAEIYLVGGVVRDFYLDK